MVRALGDGTPAGAASLSDAALFPQPALRCNLFEDVLLNVLLEFVSVLLSRWRSKGGRKLKISGSRLKALREQHFWSQEELAERAGLNRATIYKAEHGSGVSPRTGRALAQALNVDTTELLTDTRTGSERMQDRLAPRVERLEELELPELSDRLSELRDRLADLKEPVAYKGGTKEEVRDWQAYEAATDEILALSLVLQRKASKQPV